MQAIELLGTVLQVFPLVEDQIMVTSADGVGGDGVFIGARAFDCRVDGNITITFSSGATKTFTAAAGERYGIPEAYSLAIVSGTFNVA